jgi:hypothetical protein
MKVDDEYLYKFRKPRKEHKLRWIVPKKAIGITIPKAIGEKFLNCTFNISVSGTCIMLFLKND